jgi:hypothetical protein
MGVESAEDRLSFLDPDEFGIAATVGTATVYGIFDDAHEAIFDDEVGTTAPQFVCRTADVTSVVRGTSIVINSVTYKVTAVEPDGTGMTTLVLSKD